MTANQWTAEEIELLESNLHLNTISIYRLFEEEFPGERTYDAVQKKIKSVRKNLSVFCDETKEKVKDGSFFCDADFDLDEVDESDNGEDAEPIFQPEGEYDEKDEVWNPRNYGDDDDEEENNISQATTREMKDELVQWLKTVSKHYQGLEHQYNPPLKEESVDLVLFLSDLHFGQKTDQFSVKEAQARLHDIPQYLLENGPFPEIETLHIVLGGDLVEGEDVYCTQNGALECPVIKQTQLVTESLWQLFLDCRATFKCPVIVDMVPGNHGAMSRTADPRSNWDNVVHMFLSMLSEQSDDEELIVNLNFEKFQTIQVRDQVGLVNHYGTKHQGTPAMQVKTAGWIITNEADFFLHGHWHQWGIETYLGKPIISNGSLCGPNDLSKQMAKDEPARQAWMIVKSNSPICQFGFLEW